jgi:hypothetical protein
MTFEEQTIHTKLISYFRKKNSVTRADIKSFFIQSNPGLSEQDFRKALDLLIKRDSIVHAGRDLYLIQSSYPTKKNKYSPSGSHSVREVGNILRKSFPYLNFALWETHSLYEFMNHQPMQNQIIVDVPKDALESVFNTLSKHFNGKVFLDPDRELMERYVIAQEEAVIVSRLISQTAKKKIDGIYFAPLENILVDLLIEKEIFYIFQGEELALIYQNAFSKYWINEKAMLRYAGRRKAIPQLKSFILQHPEIDSIIIQRAIQ